MVFPFPPMKHPFISETKAGSECLAQPGTRGWSRAQPGRTSARPARRGRRWGAVSWLALAAAALVALPSCRTAKEKEPSPNTEMREALAELEEARAEISRQLRDVEQGAGNREQREALAQMRRELDKLIRQLQAQMKKLPVPE